MAENLLLAGHGPVDESTGQTRGLLPLPSQREEPDRQSKLEDARRNRAGGTAQRREGVGLGWAVRSIRTSLSGPRRVSDELP